ncbi:hypothetical protein VTK73DRAFT_6610 [Phialemonium thermophilum]|uniref:Uncharacterized protein n=1 Tax=Phialemonium thermophilum TaxID=223376 RepID=A0ABR3WJ10_9PEZI
MNRTVLRSASALSRGRVEIGTPPAHRAFSTTQDRPAESNNGNGTQQPRSTSRQRSAVAASKLSDLAASGSSKLSSSGGAIDARSLGASLPGNRGSIGPSVVNLRSLNGRLPTFKRQTLTQTGQAGTFNGGRGGRSGLRRSGGPQGPAGQLVRGRGGDVRGRGGARGGRRGGRRQRKSREHEDTRDEDGWTEEQKSYFDRVEQGVVTPYAPALESESLLGHGPALATDGSMAQVESAMRAMRILAGGRPFNLDSYYSDPKDNVRRYLHEKMPVFFDNVHEKTWLEESTNVRIRGPREETKAAIVRTTVLGRYEGPKFAPLGDTLGILANFHIREPTYTVAAAEKFAAKVLSLLPTTQKGAQNAGNKVQKA